MSSIQDRINLIREGSSLASTIIGDVDIASSILQESEQDANLRIAIMESITNMWKNPDLINEGASDSLSTAAAYVTKAIKVIQEKIAKFFAWLKSKFMVKNTKDVGQFMAMKKDILAYKGNHSLYVPTKLFTNSININKIREGLDHVLQQMSDIEKMGDDALSKYGIFTTFKNDPGGLSQQIFKTAISGAFDIPESIIYNREQTLDAIYGPAVLTNLSTIRPSLVIEKFLAFKDYMSEVIGYVNYLSKRLTAEKVFRRDRDITVLMRFLTAITEGLLRAVQRICTILEYGFKFTVRVGVRMGYKEAPAQN
jgi:hypothetical protein